ncbi:MAG: hypothetical protein R2874_09115 [Desulfobacterales bacterium]
MVNSRQFDGLDNIAAQDKIADYLKPTISASGQSVSDSGTGAFSRQRFWGHARAMIHCDSCGIVPVAEEDLPAFCRKMSIFWKGAAPPFQAGRVHQHHLSGMRQTGPPKPIPWTRLWNLPGILSAIAEM